MEGRNHKGLSLLAMVCALVATSVAHAGQRYIVSFKKPEAYKATAVQWRNSKALQQFGLALPGDVGQGLNILQAGGQVVRALDHVQMMIVDLDSEAAAQKLAANPLILDVEEEIFLPLPKPLGVGERVEGQFAPTAACPVNDMPWGISAVKANQVWSTTQGDRSRVLVLDTGIDKNHQDLRSRFEKGQDFTSAKANKAGSSDVTDTIGHGTHVSGTIAADGTCISGVAPKSKILMGRVCAANGCSTAAIVMGIDWGVQENVQVISMSLGGPLATPSQQRAVDRAEKANVVVVAATGNDGVRRVSYPAAFPSVIAVGAVGRTPDGNLKRADFSQYGPGLDITAPGVEVVSSVPVGFGRVSSVMVDLGDGKSTRVKSTSFAGAPQNETPIKGTMVPAGLGKPEDFNGLNLRGKFALIQRGDIPFKDKVLNAVNAGASGVVIYNNADGLAHGTIGPDGSVNIPVAMVEKAVGEQIKSALTRGAQATASISTEKSDYDSYDGTSMATPHVAGVVALIRSANPGLTPAQVRDLLSRTAVSMNNPDEYGAGVVDAKAAVSAALVTAPLSVKVSGF